MVSEAAELSAILRGAKIVLILVLVEDGLRVATIERISTWNQNVLILVLVEDGLRVRFSLEFLSHRFYKS